MVPVLLEGGLGGLLAARRRTLANAGDGPADALVTDSLQARKLLRRALVNLPAAGQRELVVQALRLPLAQPKLRVQGCACSLGSGGPSPTRARAGEAQALAERVQRHGRRV